ncbi:hypothetical protein ABIC17_000986 [Sphingomonas sp. PvP056]
MSHSGKRSKSHIEQFRMVVPKDVRGVIGKTAWTESLRTTDHLIACRKRADLVARYTAEIGAAREGIAAARAGIAAAQAEIARQAEVDAVALLDQAFQRLAKARGSMDRAIQLQLQLLANLVVDSWAGAGQDLGEQWWGDFLVREPVICDEPVPSLDSERERTVYRLKANLLEGRGIIDGLVHQELAAILLDRGVYHPLWSVVSYMRSLEPDLPLEPDTLYEVVAKAYLRRLVDHRFDSWPENVIEALSPLGWGAAPAEPAKPQPVPIAVPRPVPVAVDNPSLSAMRLLEGLQYWINQRRPRQSAVTEARRGVARYIALFGDVIVGDITRAQVIEFRNLIADIPPQTELAKLAATRSTLRSVIDQALQKRKIWEESDRQQPEPGRLAPGSVKKDVGAISQILGAIYSDLGEGTNVAAGIQIAGYSRTRQGQQLPHLSFTPMNTVA